MRETTVRALVMAKWADYRPMLPAATLLFLGREAFLEVARHDQRVVDEVACGLLGDLEADFHEPVLADVAAELVTVCPPIMREVVDPEPPRIQRAFVEGSFLRRLFRLLVDGDGWEAEAQVRAVMARHYPFHLAAVEAVEAVRPGPAPGDVAGADQVEIRRPGLDSGG